MTNERIQEILTAIGSTSNLIKMLDGDPETAVAELQAKGFSVTVDELKTMVAELVKMSENSDGELSEGDMEEVAGGLGLLGIFVLGAALGTAAYFSKHGTPDKWV